MMNFFKNIQPLGWGKFSVMFVIGTAIIALPDLLTKENAELLGYATFGLSVCTLIIVIVSFAVFFLGGDSRGKKLLLQHLDLTGREHVLDIGCNDCTFLKMIAPKLNKSKNGRGAGVDLYPEKMSVGSGTVFNANGPPFFDKVRADIEKSGFSDVLDIQKADFTKPLKDLDLNFKPNSFDYVCCSLVLHHVGGGLDQMLNNALTVLKPGGKFIILEILRKTTIKNSLIGHKDVEDVKQTGNLPSVAPLLAEIIVATKAKKGKKSQ